MGWPDADTFVTDDELNNYIVDSARELHSLLVNLWPAGQFGRSAQLIPTIVGQSSYNLLDDFSRLIGVRMQIADSYVPIEPLDPTVDLLLLSTRSWDYARTKYWVIRESDTLSVIQFYPPPAAVYTVVVFYIEKPPAFVDDSATSWMGEDEYIVLDCCIKCAAKQEQDPGIFVQQKERYQKRLEDQATPLDLGRAPTVQDVRSAASREDIWWFRR